MTANILSSQRHDLQISDSVTTATNSRAKSTVTKNNATKRLRAEEEITSDNDADSELVMKTVKVFHEKLMTNGTHFFESWKMFDEIEEQREARFRLFEQYMGTYSRSCEIDRSIEAQLDALELKIDQTSETFQNAFSKELVQNVDTILQCSERVSLRLLRKLERMINKYTLELKYDDSRVNFRVRRLEFVIHNLEEERQQHSADGLQYDASRAAYAQASIKLSNERRRLSINMLLALVNELGLSALDTIKNGISMELMNKQGSESIPFPTDDDTAEAASQALAESGSPDNKLQNTPGEDDDGYLANASSPTLNTIVTPDVALLIQAIESGSAQKVSRVIRQVSPFVDTVLDGEYKEKMWTPLHLAADLGETDVIDALMLLNPFLDFQDMDGNTPVMIAALKGHCKAVSLLIGYGAVVSIMNDNNQCVTDILDDVADVTKDGKRKTKSPQAKKLKKK